MNLIQLVPLGVQLTPPTRCCLKIINYIKDIKVKPGISTSVDAQKMIATWVRPVNFIRFHHLKAERKKKQRIYIYIYIYPSIHPSIHLSIHPSLEVSMIPSIRYLFFDVFCLGCVNICELL